MKKTGVLKGSPKTVRVLLRFKEKPHSFYAAPGQWVSTPDEALDFAGSAEAIRFAQDEGLGNVELVFSYEDPDLNVSFSLHSRQTGEEPFCRRHPQHQFAA